MILLKKQRSCCRSVCGWSLPTVLLFSLLAEATMASSTPRERSSFNSDWRFTQGDPAVIGDELSYTNIKPWVMANGDQFAVDGQHFQPPAIEPATNVSYTWPDFNDTSWTGLTLPHDWGMPGPFNRDFPGATGKLPWAGIGWYRKHFYIPASDSGR